MRRGGNRLVGAALAIAVSVSAAMCFAAGPGANGPDLETMFSGPDLPGGSFEEPGRIEDQPLPTADTADFEEVILDARGASCCGRGCCTEECEDAPGLIQFCRHHSKARWTGRIEALLLWRNAPANRAIFSEWNPDTKTRGDSVIGAGDLESTPAAGPRISLFRHDCSGHTAEFTYFRAFNFRAQAATPPSFGGYALGSNIYGNKWVGLDAGTVNLGSGLQSFEINERKCCTDNLVLLAGLRWFEWRESVNILDRFTDPRLGFEDDLYNTRTMNSLYGGQIGFDARIWDRGNWLRVDGLMKGGAYYNLATQHSSYQYGPVGGDKTLVGVTGNQFGQAAFVGEVGLTGTIPLTHHFDFTFGYLGLWLEGLAQPTDQLRRQRIIPDSGKATGSIVTTGGTVVQGVTIGLNGRW